MRKISLFIIVVVFLGCLDNNNNLKELQRKNFTNSDYPFKTKPNDFSIDTCTRIEIDACDYTNINNYSEAFRNELNRLLQECPSRNWDCNPSPCCLTKLEYDFNNWTDVVDNTSRCPFGYCLQRSDCNSWTCPINNLVYHNYADISFQNSILTFVRSWAAANRPSCGTVLASIFKIEIIKTLDHQTRCDENTYSDCHNRHWELNVYYTCGPCEEE